MRFDVITIFPRAFASYFAESLIKRACREKIITIVIHNLRDFASDKHRTVDDRPYGGGPGMVLKIEPIYKCLDLVRKKSREFFKLRRKKNFSSRVILLSAKGKKFTQKEARRLAKYDNLVFVCGRYEGVDERVACHLADEEISIGDYVLAGGEIPAMVILEAVARLQPSFLGNSESLKSESHSKADYLEYPHYTKPASFQGWKVPAVLLSGNHKKIQAWREKKTKFVKQRQS